ncbi:MAG: transposase [Chloroflexi bacterium]|nr:transposase [Chloroflexota bacterium]
MTNNAYGHRRSIRLHEYDYTLPGAYFVTICTADRACLFGEVVGGEMRLNDHGRVVEDEWARASAVRANVTLDATVVMPNHIHGIIVINDTVPVCVTSVGATRRVAPTGPVSGSVGAIIGQFKSIVTKRINASRGTPGAAVWQRNYYEHVIRDDVDLEAIRWYVFENPSRWGEDPANPQVKP